MPFNAEEMKAATMTSLLSLLRRHFLAYAMIHWHAIAFRVFGRPLSCHHALRFFRATAIFARRRCRASPFCQRRISLRDGCRNIDMPEMTCEREMAAFT